MSDPESTTVRPLPATAPGDTASTAIVPPATSATATGTAPRDLRPAFRRLGTGLLIYGAIGLTLAILGLLALLYAGNRIGGLADRTTQQVETVIATLEDTSTVLIDAGSTAGSFAVTLERTPPTVRQAATTIGNLQSQLRRVSSQLDVFSILGSNPLSGVSSLFGDLATDLEGLDTRLELIARDLEDNRDKLVTNSQSLNALGVRLQLVADDLREGVIQDSLADVQLIVTVLAFLFVVWTAVPAVGALFLGRWLRTELAPD
jgi:hypothetical protein